MFFKHDWKYMLHENFKKLLFFFSNLNEFLIIILWNSIQCFCLLWSSVNLLICNKCHHLFFHLLWTDHSIPNRSFHFHWQSVKQKLWLKTDLIMRILQYMWRCECVMIRKLIWSLALNSFICSEAKEKKEEDDDVKDNKTKKKNKNCYWL